MVQIYSKSMIGMVKSLYECNIFLNTKKNMYQLKKMKVHP